MPQHKPLGMAITRIPSPVFLLTAVTIFGTAGAVTQRLIMLGAEHTVSGHNPISFCNLLFTGNLCALLLLIPLYRNQLGWHHWRQLSRQTWFNLLLVAVLAGALAPMLSFFGLANTSVNNVILIGRIEPPLSLVLALVFLQERTNIWVIVGALLSFLGVALTVILATPDATMMSMMGMNMGAGIVMVAGAAVAGAIATVVSRAALPEIPLGLFNVVRTAVGTLVFLTVVLSLFGPPHFQELFSPFLWQWSLIYSAVIVVVGQLAWFAGIRAASVGQISLASSFTPIVGILAAYAILGEVPTTAQYLGGLLVMGGIVLNQIGIQRFQRPRSQLGRSPDVLWRLLDAEVGFKGI